MIRQRVDIVDIVIWIMAITCAGVKSMIITTRLECPAGIQRIVMNYLTSILSGYGSVTVHRGCRMELGARVITGTGLTYDSRCIGSIALLCHITRVSMRVRPLRIKKCNKTYIMLRFSGDNAAVVQYVCDRIVNLIGSAVRVAEMLQCTVV